MIKRLGVLTSGGDSPGMNPSIRSVVRTGINLGVEVIGIENGYQGIFDHQFIPLGALEVSGKIRDAGTFLATTRCMAMMQPDGPSKVVEILKQNKIDALVVIGGDGSLTGLSVARSSGIPELDQAVVSGVQRASPFPPLPSEWGKPSWTFTQEVQVTGR